jgi:hypothetical protein
MANEFIARNGLIALNSSQITGSLNVSAGITGSLQGTASYATNALSASYAATASYATYAANGGVTKILAGANVNLSPISGLGDVTVTSFGTNLYNTATGSYGSFYDTGSVLATSATTAYSMSLNTTDISNGVFVSASNGDNTRVKFTNAGTYNLQFSSQFSNTDNSNQDVIIWIKKNGVDIPDSSGVVGVPTFKAGSNGQVIASWNYYLSLSANDYIQMCWHVEQANVITLETIPAGVSPTHPRTPSTILTATRVDTFLSNTGSFSGSFTGDLLGTASFATQALSASYAPAAAGTPAFPFTGSALITGSLGVTGSLFVQDINGIINIDSSNRNLYDTNSSSSIDWSARRLYDIAGNRAISWQSKVLGNSNGGSSVGWDYPNLTQAVEFLSYTRNNIDLGVVGENFANFPNYAAFQPQGEILKNGVTFDAAVADFDLVYLETGNTWYPVSVATTGSRKMLGIAFGVANFDPQVLIEGTMVVNDGTYTDTPKVDLVAHGLPIYIRTGGGTFMSTTAPGSSGDNVRVLGHAYYNSTTAGEYWIMKFRPSNSWVTI